MGLENFSAERQPPREEDLTRCEEKALNKFEKESYNDRIQVDDFRNLYSKEEIIEDNKKVEKKKEQMEKDKTERAVLLEKIFIAKAEMFEWFGDGYVCPTTEFDDIMNGTDFIIEYEDEDGGQPLCLAVDCTVSEDKGIILDKIIKTEEGIQNGKLTSIKYFRSEAETTSDGKRVCKFLSMAPKVVISVDKQKIKDFCKEYSENKDLGNSYMQIFILEEIAIQLDNQISQIENKELKIKDYVSEEQKEKMLKKIKKTREHIKEIIKEKRHPGLIDTKAADRAIRESVFFDCVS